MYQQGNDVAANCEFRLGRGLRVRGLWCQGCAVRVQSRASMPPGTTIIATTGRSTLDEPPRGLRRATRRHEGRHAADLALHLPPDTGAARTQRWRNASLAPLQGHRVTRQAVVRLGHVGRTASRKATSAILKAAGVKKAADVVTLPNRRHTEEDTETE